MVYVDIHYHCHYAVGELFVKSVELSDVVWGSGVLSDLIVENVELPSLV